MTLDYYNQHGEPFVQRTRHIDMRDLYKPFLQHLSENAYVLDAGCGSGRDSRYFIEQGYRVLAIDGSETLVAMASDYIGQPVSLMRFDQLDIHETFDGIWACASLLHLPRADLPDIFARFIAALKVNGVWHLSFQWGTSERQASGRHFTDFDADTFQAFIQAFPQMKMIHLMKTHDKQNHEIGWLNVVLQKVS